MSTSYNRNQPQKSKAKLYWAIGIVLGIIVAALLIYNSGIFQSRAVAATVGDQSFTVPELSYYYNAQISNKRQEAQMYAQFGMESDYNTDLKPEEQYYNEAEGVTYADYFLDQALEALKKDTILCTEAKAAGYTLSRDGQAAIEENLDALHMYSTQSGYSESAYLKLLYGQYMTKSMFKELLSNTILASEYAAEKQASFEYSEDELNSYYEDNKADLNTYDYRYCFISGQAQSTTDADGNTVEPTEEESVAAMADAKSKADTMTVAIQGGTAFNDAAVEVLDETDGESFKDEEYNHTAVLGKYLDSNYKSWLQDENRNNGEVTALETSSGYYVVQFLGSSKDEETYQTINYRNLLILSETTDTEVPTTDASALTATDDASAEDVSSADTAEPEVEIISLPSQEQLAAAKEEAQGLVDQFKAGEQTPEAFGALASANSDDEATQPDGGLVENANKDNLSADLTEWLFADGRKAGDVTDPVLEYKDSSDRVMGYQILYVDSLGQVAWRYAATTALQAEDYEAWYEETEANYPAELTDKGKAIAGTPNVAEDTEADIEATEDAVSEETAEPATEEVEEVAEEVAQETEAAVEEEAEAEPGDAETEDGGEVVTEPEEAAS